MDKPGHPGSGSRLRDIVAEGLYIAAAATRLTLKNRILVELIAADADFEVDRFLPVARDTLEQLAQEADEEARRANAERKRASFKFTVPDSTHDYRSRDTKNLRRRMKQSRHVARQLREKAADDDQLRALIASAREAAWTEISRNIDRRLLIESARPDLEPDYERLRAVRMQSLRLIDLPKLAAQRRRAGEESNDPELPLTGPSPQASGIDLNELDD